jgi:hypothetical protein
MMWAMLRTIERALDRRATVYAACAVSLALGLFFIFVWSPLPFGWKGIDFYYEIAQSLAKGEPFPTLNIVWGYAYFLAFWYRIFGDHAWIPLCVQAVVNAAIPLMAYHLVRAELGHRIAVATAVLIALFSFNTVYAATQASDSICTALFVAAMLCFARADRARRWPLFAAAGVLAGIAYQFRPNLLLYPPFLAALYVLRPPRAGVLAASGVFLGGFLVAAAPWVIRTYRWTGLIIPASTHGAKQLWFGTLQISPYEDSWLYNPRAAFEFPPLDYTSIDELPPVVTALPATCAFSSHRVDLVYWTSRDRTRRRLTTSPANGAVAAFTLPVQPSPTAVYYYFENAGDIDGQRHDARTPANGDDAPLMTVVSRDHLGDLDVDGYVLDIFDVARMVRHITWGDQLPVGRHDSVRGERPLDLDEDGAITERDVRMAVSALIHDRDAAVRAPDEVERFDRGATSVTVALRDGSAFTVPRQPSDRISDIALKPVGVASMVSLVVGRSRPFPTLRSGRPAVEPKDLCVSLSEIGFNQAVYRQLPHEMRRFDALALDNIRRDPLPYLAASLRRVLRIFIIEGSADEHTAYQFSGASRIYRVGQIISVVYLTLLVAGIVIALRKGMRLFMLLVPIVYVPLTICFMLVTARYSMTTQPFAFAFVAVALVTALERLAGERRTHAFRAPESPQAARQSRAAGSAGARE